MSELKTIFVDFNDRLALSSGGRFFKAALSRVEDAPLGTKFNATDMDDLQFVIELVGRRSDRRYAIVRVVEQVETVLQPDDPIPVSDAVVCGVPQSSEPNGSPVFASENRVLHAVTV